MTINYQSGDVDGVIIRARAAALEAEQYGAGIAACPAFITQLQANAHGQKVYTAGSNHRQH
jgi:hypothetical protein